MRSGRSVGIERDDDGREVLPPFWPDGRQLDAGDDSLGLGGDDADRQLGRVVDRERDLLAGDDRVVAGDEHDLELLAEGRRLRVEEVALVGRARQVDRRPRTACRPARRPAAAARPTIGTPSFVSRTSIASHEPSRAWPSRRTRASIGGPSAAAAVAAAGPAVAPTRTPNERHTGDERSG